MRPQMLLAWAEHAAVSWSETIVRCGDVLSGLEARMVIAVVLLSFGLWCLQPGSRRGRRVLGIATLLIGLAVAVTLLDPLGFLPVAVAFRMVAGLCLIAAVATVTSRNPVYCAIWFALTLVGTASLMLMWSAQFVAIATIAVYAGAIVVTFLFVLMLAQSSGRASYDRLTWGLVPAWLAAPTAVCMFLMLVWGIARWRESVPVAGQAILRVAVIDAFDAAAADVAASSDLEPPAWARLREIQSSQVHRSPRLTVELSADVYESVQQSQAQDGICQRIADRLSADGLGSEHLSAENISIQQVGRLNDLLTDDHVAALGGQMFTRYLIPVQIVATLLLAALVGAVAIASYGPSALKGEVA